MNDDTPTQGSTANCGNTYCHDSHIWVAEGRTVPIACPGVSPSFTHGPWEPEGVDADGSMVESMPLGQWVEQAKVKRCPHCSVEDGTPHYWDCATRQPKGSIHSQEEFLTALDILLDHTRHADECHIDENDTTCVCVIGKVRAVLPTCGAIKTRGTDWWQCTRTAHPSSPDRHVFG